MRILNVNNGFAENYEADSILVIISASVSLGEHMSTFSSLRRLSAALGCVALVSALTVALPSHSAHAAQDVTITASGEAVLTGTDIQMLAPTGDNAAALAGLVCDAQAPKERYEVGFQGVLDMSNVWAKWRQMSFLGALAAILKPHLHPDKLLLIGEWETSFTVDPQHVEIAKEQYTVEAVQTRFEEANKDNGSVFASFMRVQSVGFENGVFTARFKLQTKGADGTYTDGILGAELKKPGATPNKVYLPSLDDSMYVTQEKLQALAQAKTPLLASKPTASGYIDVPRLQHIYASGINEMRPINFPKSVGADVTITAGVRPHVEVQHASNAPTNVAVPTEVSVFDSAASLALNADPDTAARLPEVGKKVETETATWTYTGATATKGACGKRTYVANWTYEKKILEVAGTFESADKGIDLPMEITQLLPKNGTVERNQTATPGVASFDPVAIAADPSAGGKPTVWIFEGWAPARVENVTEDVTFHGKWVRKLAVTPELPTLKVPASAGMEKTINIPVVDGLTYTTQRNGNEVTVTAVAQDGYAIALNAPHQWTFDVSADKVDQSSAKGDVKPGQVKPSGKIAQTGSTAMLVLAIAAVIAVAGGVLFLIRTKR